MALDTSMMTPDVHRRVKAGETIEAIAASFDHTPPVTPDAVRQYLAKIDEHGRSRPTPIVRTEVDRVKR